MRKYNLNENYFEKINHERKAYWLGFISADGNITSTNKFTKSLRLRINLHERDVHILEDFKNDLESESSIKYFVSNKNTKLESPEVKFEVNSNKLCGDLINLGITPNKTFSLCFPNIPEELFKHYIRGFVDGDGSFSYSKRKDKDRYCFSFEIVGASLCFLQSIQKYFKDNNIITNIYKRKNKDNYRLMSASSKEIVKIIHLLYDDSHLYLNRKYIITRKILKLAV